jgi:ubiquinone/menaquinone biosynthesis C-methylase UbiE
MLGPSSPLSTGANIDAAVVRGFGDEWSRFDQSGLSEAELREMFGKYFSIFPWELLPPDAQGFDLGSGSGRWARFVSERVGNLHCIDASGEALNIARLNLAQSANCTFHHASVDAIPLSPESMDFGYSLGVLHHVPDTAAAIHAAVIPLKKGAPLLLYLYYRMDNRPRWFRALWRVADVLRLLISRLPKTLRYLTSQLISVLVYWPLARTARLLARMGMKVDAFPLSYYRDRAFYVMRNDALDRFGTRLEQRFTRAEIEGMMQGAGLDAIRFREDSPYWCAVGTKR